MHLYTVLDFSGPKPQRLCANLHLEAALELFKRKTESPQVALVREDFLGDEIERELLIRLVSERNVRLEADVEAHAGDRDLVRTEETRRHVSAAQKASRKRGESREAELNYQLALFRVYRHILEIWEADKERDRRLDETQSQDLDLGR